jgi:general secretion pathway protein G
MTSPYNFESHLDAAQHHVQFPHDANPQSPKIARLHPHRTSGGACHPDFAGRFGGATGTGQLGGAKSKTAGVQIADIEKSLELFKLDVGRFPTAEEGLASLVTKPETAAGWNGPYIKGSLPNDPWGKPYQYAPAAGGNVDVLSLGADGAPGGDGENADVKNKN